VTPAGPRAPQPAYVVWWRDLRRAAAWHRRLLTAGLLAAAVAFALQSVAPSPPPGRRVLVAAHDLAGGALLSAGDVTLRELPPAAVPTGALTSADEVSERTLAGPVRAGEVLTDLRLAGRSLVARYGDGLVAVPVRIADAASVRLLRPGDVVDVLAAGVAERGGGDAAGQPATARLVASAVPVLTVPTVPRDALGVNDPTGGALLVVATTDPTAARLAAAAVSQRLSVVLR
jgi:Flp pilus assembly protein CpaB